MDTICFCSRSPPDNMFKKDGGLVALPRIKCINLKLTSDGGEAVLKSRESIEELTVQKEVLTSASPQFRNVVPIRRHQRIVSKICHILAWHCPYLLVAGQLIVCYLSMIRNELYARRAYFYDSGGSSTQYYTIAKAHPVHASTESVY